MQNYTFDANGRQVNAAGNFFRYESADVNAADPRIKLRVNGEEQGYFMPGEAKEFLQQMQLWEITPMSGAGEVRIGSGRLTSSRMVISGGVQSLRAAFVNTQKTVTPASSTLLAANTARQYLLIQNKDSVGTIWLHFTAGNATQASGIKIPPGGNYEPAVMHNGAIQVIGDAASNANVVVVEG